jgi:hypothetical protein
MISTRGSDHLYVYLNWRALLARVHAALKTYQMERMRYITYLALHVWNVLGREDNRVENIFVIMHSKCCNGTKLNCKAINSDTEKKVITLLEKMWQENIEFSEDDIGFDPDVLPKAKAKLKKLQQEVDDYSIMMIKKYMRMAIWREHLSFPLSILETFLYDKDGLMAIGLGGMPGVWSMYSNLKKLPIFCYKRKMCRQCFSEKADKLIPCKDCGCVYFCNKSFCASNSRDDQHYGHTMEECGLFKAKKIASTLQFAAAQMTQKM